MKTTCDEMPSGAMIAVACAAFTAAGVVSQFALSWTDPSVKQFKSVESSSLIAPKSKVCDAKLPDKVTTDGIVVIAARGQLMNKVKT